MITWVFIEVLLKHFGIDILDFRLCRIGQGILLSDFIFQKRQQKLVEDIELQRPVPFCFLLRFNQGDDLLR